EQRQRIGFSVPRQQTRAIQGKKRGRDGRVGQRQKRVADRFTGQVWWNENFRVRLATLDECEVSPVFMRPSAAVGFEQASYGPTRRAENAEGDIRPARGRARRRAGFRSAASGNQPADRQPDNGRNAKFPRSR